MEGPYTRFMQLTEQHADSSIFARDLMTLLDAVGRPVAEFRSKVIPGGDPDEIHYEVECTLRGAVVPPETETSVFMVRARSWTEGIRRATQEAIARVAGLDHGELHGTRYHFYGRRDAEGGPTHGVYHPQLGYHLNRMECHLIGTQAYLDESRFRHDNTLQLLHSTHQELQAKDQEIASLKEQVANLQANNTTLIGHTQFLRTQLEDMEAMMEEVTDEAQSTTHTPDAEEPEMEEDPEEPFFIDIEE